MLSNKLRWQCRRGTLELDIVFQRYLESCYLKAGPLEQQGFLQLTELEDNQLLAYLLTEQLPDNPLWQDIILKMRKLSD